MTRADRRLERAVRLTPEADRTRYEPEWRADLAAACQEGGNEGEVSRAAFTMAVRLRLRQMGRSLLGARGPSRAVVAWTGVLLVMLLAFLVGNIALVFAVLMVAGLAVAMVQAGLPTRWSHRLLVASVVLAAVSFAYVWWVTGVAIDAADSGAPMPPLAAWGGAGIVGVLLGVLGVIVSAVIAVAHERSRRRSH